MQLKRLTGLERSKIEEELKELKKIINYLESLLKDVMKILKVIKDEILYLKEKYGDERRTKVIKSRPGEITDEQLIENKEVIVVMTQDYMLFFTNQGRIFQTRVWDVPLGTRTSKGKAIVNLLTLRPEENVTSILTFGTAETEEKELYILMATKKGTVKKTAFTQFANIRNNGIVAIKLDKGDELLWVKLTNGKKNVILTTRDGKAIVFKEQEIRPTGRASMGVRGINIEKDNEVTSADAFGDSEFTKDLMVAGERGVGKKTKLSLFRGQHRGGKGVKVASVDDKMGKIAFAEIIQPGKTTVIITSTHGQVVKIPVQSIPSRSRSAKGVILMRFSKANDRIVGAALV